MEELLKRLREETTEKANNEDFIHHEWFITYHLNIVEKISLELCEIYKDADRDLVVTLVWIHDYGKILNREKEHDIEMIEKSRELLKDLEFPKAFTDKAVEYLIMFEKKIEVDLRTQPIEIQIVSSADGAAHFFGPLYTVYWKDNHELSAEELMDAQRKKLTKDWEYKMVLPEVREKFKVYHEAIKAQAGILPEKYL